MVAAAVAGIVVFRQQGTAAGRGRQPVHERRPGARRGPRGDRRDAGLPVRAARAAARCARSPARAAFLGLARAARSALTPALPAFALVLALTVAAFAGMVRDAVTNGDAAASWKAAGADVTISGLPGFPGFTMPPAAPPARSPPCPA